MLTKATIERFYADLAALGLKHPVAAIAKATGYSKGNVSEWINKKKEPSQNFMDKFYQEFYKGSLNDLIEPLDNGKVSDARDTPLPLGNITRTLADYIAMIENYNTTLSNAINSGLVDIKDSLKKAESNLSQGQKNIEKQLLHSTENLGELMAKHKSDLMENTSLKKGSGLGRRKARDGDGERKGHQ